MFQGHCLSGICDLVTVEFCINNARFDSPTLTDERALTLVREVTDTDRLPAKNDPATFPPPPPPPPGNFADIVCLKEQSFLHRIRDVCTL